MQVTKLEILTKRLFEFLPKLQVELMKLTDSETLIDFEIDQSKK